MCTAVLRLVEFCGCVAAAVCVLVRLSRVDAVFLCLCDPPLIMQVLGFIVEGLG